MAKELSTSGFREYFEKKIRGTIKNYSLFKKKDRIAVAVSGGKDSTSCLYVLKMLGYNVEAISIDPVIGEYTKINLKNIKRVCADYNIKLYVYSFRDEFGSTLRRIQSNLKAKGIGYSACMLCGILKRNILNRYSKKLKFDYLATGHNLDDEAQAFLMNVFRNDFGRAIRQGPVSGIVKSSKFVQRVKPLYLVREEEVLRYSKIMKFPVNYEICPLSVDAYRRQFINILDKFEEKHPSVKYNIIRFHENMVSGIKKVKDADIGSCRICGEPTSNDICKTCLILREFSSKL